MNIQMNQKEVTPLRKYRLEQHERVVKKLNNKKEIAELKQKEWLLRYEILKTYLPFLNWNIPFKKKAVIISLVAPAIYTVAAFLLQKNTSIEISPSLTVAFFALYGTELFNASRIKMNEDKYLHDDYIGE